MTRPTLTRAILVPLLLLAPCPSCLASAAGPPPIRIVLTFDDGPDAREDHISTTVRVAEILKRKALNGIADDIKAAFFVQTGISYRGGCPRGLEILRSLRDQGHVLGVHTGTVGDASVDHLDHVKLQQSGTLGQDMDLARDRLRQAGTKARYVRPTFGHFNLEVLETYKSHGLQIILWDVNSKDAALVKDRPVESGWRPPNDKEVIQTLQTGKDSVSRAIFQGKRDLVVLFHDVSPTTAAHLPAYLQAIRKTAAEVGGAKYNVEFTTRTADIQSIFADREDEGEAFEAALRDRATTIPAPDDSVADTPTVSESFWMVIVAGAAAGFLAGLLAAVGLRRRRPAAPQSLGFPVSVLEALVQETALTGAQAACVADRLQKLRLTDLDQIELAVYLVLTQQGEGRPNHMTDSGAGNRAAQLAENAGLVEKRDGAIS